ncbi:MAG: hypothetical protein J6S85_01370 [Methanobrevibacter sp.]|nr:hypothetical protein [Methanobrevibacter sp.]
MYVSQQSPLMVAARRSKTGFTPSAKANGFSPVGHLYNIGTVVVGYNKDFKLSPSIGKINNQNFVQLPLGDLRLTVSYLCERYNMRYIEQEESYTSKSSYIDNDILPIYQPEQPYQGTFMGKRVYRGLYKSANGVTINADVNGALNILRKANGGTLPCRGFLANPKRIRLV